MDKVRLGIVLPSFCYNNERLKLAARAFETLRSTRSPSFFPRLLLVLSPSTFEYPTGDKFGVFDLETETDPSAQGTEQTLAYGTQRMLDSHPDVTHVTWMGDDALFHPEWLVQLEALIGRHPAARSWSVYRSAYEAIHWVHYVDFASSDRMVNSICGHGMTFSREEWAAWGIKWQSETRWRSAYGDTLDMHHAANFKGDRWATFKSYVEHTGRCGINCRPEIPEYAQEFQGTEVADVRG